ncbi:hypothetical protein PCE1_004829 [Barthelona sp. PCE]
MDGEQYLTQHLDRIADVVSKTCSECCMNDPAIKVMKNDDSTAQYIPHRILELIEGSLSTFHIDLIQTLQEKITKLEQSENVAELSTQIDNLQSLNAMLRARAENVEVLDNATMNSSVCRELVQLGEMETNELSREADELRKQLALVTEEMALLKEQNKDLKKSNGLVNVYTEKDVYLDVPAIRSEVRGMRSEVEELIELCEADLVSRARITQLDGENKRLRHDRNRLKAEVDVLSEESAAMKKREHEIGRRVEESQGILVDLLKKHKTVSLEYKTMQKNYEDMQTEYTREQQKACLLREELDHVRKSNESVIETEVQRKLQTYHELMREKIDAVGKNIYSQATVDEMLEAKRLVLVRQHETAMEEYKKKLMVDVEDHVACLQAQIRRAKPTVSLHKELVEIVGDDVVQNVRKLQEENADLREKCKTALMATEEKTWESEMMTMQTTNSTQIHLKQIEQLTERNAALEAQLESVDERAKRVDDVFEENARVTSKNTELQTNVEAIEAVVSEKTKTIQALKSQINNLSEYPDKYEALRTKTEALQHTLSERDKNTLTDTHQITEQLGEFRHSLKGLSSVVRFELQHANDDLEYMMSSIQNSITALKYMSAAEIQSIKELAQKQRESEAANQSVLLQNVATIKADLLQTEKLLNSAKKRVAVLEEERNTINKRLTTEKAVTAELGNQITKQKEEITKHIDEYALLLKNHRDVLQKTRSV